MTILEALQQVAAEMNDTAARASAVTRPGISKITLSTFNFHRIDLNAVVNRLVATGGDATQPLGDK